MKRTVQGKGNLKQQNSDARDGLMLLKNDIWVYI